MATTSTRPIHQLQVRRVYPVSPEQLFRAWTTPEELKRWHAPEPMTVPLVEVDLRVRRQLSDPHARARPGLSGGVRESSRSLGRSGSGGKSSGSVSWAPLPADSIKVRSVAR
jgi:hypothetical protein